MYRSVLTVFLVSGFILTGCATSSMPAAPGYAQITGDVTRLVTRKAFAPTGPLYTWENILVESDSISLAVEPQEYARAMNHALDQLGVSGFELLAPVDQTAPPPASIAWLDSRVALIRIPSLLTSEYERRPVERLFEAAFWARAIVVDLRGTRGHAPGEAAHLAGMVLHSGTPIGRILAPTEYNAYLRKLNKESPSMEEAAAYAADRINALPSHVLPQAYAGELAVLIDRHTHGAGELVAAAIQHSLRGTVLGEATDGYGYETRRARLSDGWALDYPVALVFGPKGEPREGQSVVPDISIPPAQLGDPASLWPVLREFGTPLSGNSEF